MTCLFRRYVQMYKWPTSHVRYVFLIDDWVTEGWHCVCTRCGVALCIARHVSGIRARPLEADAITLRLWAEFQWARTPPLPALSFKRSSVIACSFTEGECFPTDKTMHFTLQFIMVHWFCSVHSQKCSSPICSLAQNGSDFQSVDSMTFVPPVLRSRLLLCLMCWIESQTKWLPQCLC